MKCFTNLQDECKTKIPSGAWWRHSSVPALLQTVPPRNHLYKVLGEAVRAERIKAGLTQEQLAEKADLARNYIGNIERAEHKVTVETLARIAKALNLRVNDLTRDI